MGRHAGPSGGSSVCLKKAMEELATEKSCCKERSASGDLQASPEEREIPFAGSSRGGALLGWIDGWFKPIDTERWVIRYTPRRNGSNWSKYNIATAWKLLNEHKMTPAGVAKLPKDALEIWEKYRPQATVIVRVTQGRGIRFADGRNYLSMVRMPARAP